jgi:hypothetical protein
MDPTDAEATRTPFRVTLRKLFNVVPRVSALVGLCLSVAVLAINPTLFTGTMFGVQLVILAVVLRLVKRKHPFGWGVVKDSKTHKPIGNAVVRLFEPKYNKLVESTLSDKRGRYSFLLGPNQYYVTINKTGYIETQIKPIDYSDKKEPTLFAMDVDLEPQATVNSE